MGGSKGGFVRLVEEPMVSEMVRGRCLDSGIAIVAGGIWRVEQSTGVSGG